MISNALEHRIFCPKIVFPELIEQCSGVLEKFVIEVDKTITIKNETHLETEKYGSEPPSLKRISFYLSQRGIRVFDGIDSEIWRCSILQIESERNLIFNNTCVLN